MSCSGQLKSANIDSCADCANLNTCANVDEMVQNKQTCADCAKVAKFANLEKNVQDCSFRCKTSVHNILIHNIFCCKTSVHNIHNWFISFFGALDLFITYIHHLVRRIFGATHLFVI